MIAINCQYWNVNKVDITLLKANLIVRAKDNVEVVLSALHVHKVVCNEVLQIFPHRLETWLEKVILLWPPHRGKGVVAEMCGYVYTYVYM